MVNIKSASFVIIMLLYEGLTQVHSQKKPRLHFGESFTLSITAIAENDRNKLAECVTFLCNTNQSPV